MNNSAIGLWCFRVLFVLFLASAGMNGYAAEQPNLKFDDADSFHGNVAAVKIDGKWGLIDVDGHVVVPVTYDAINGMSFYQGTMIVTMGDKYGLVSTTGQEILPVKYAAIMACGVDRPDNGLITVQQGGKWGVYDRTGREIAPISYDEIHIDYDGIINVRRGQAIGLLDASGHEIVPCTSKYDCVSLNHIAKTRLVLVAKDGKWGVVKDGGTELIPVVYDRVTIGDTLILVQKDQKVGFINCQGQAVIPRQYGVNTGCFSEGLALVAAQQGKCGYIDENNRTVIPFLYDSGTSFQDGLAIVARNKKTGVINKDNTVIIPFQYDDISYMVDGLFTVRIGNQYGVIDKTNTVVIPIASPDVPPLTPLAISEHDSPKVFVDLRNSRIYIKNGDKLIPTQCDRQIGPFINGRALVEVNEKLGYIDDQEGKLIIPAKYDQAGLFNNGLAAVQINHKWGYIDTNGQLIIPAKYDGAGLFENGLAPVLVNHKWGYIDRQGQFTAWSYQTGGKLGFIKYQGIEVTPLQHAATG